MSALITAAPAANSAPNASSPKAPAASVSPDKKAWKDEIHKSQGDYNANVPMADIVPDPKNRKEFEPAALQLLAEQIKAEGLIQPITLRPCPKYPAAWVGKRKPSDKAWSVLSELSDSGALLMETPDREEAERVLAIYKSGVGYQIIAGERRWRAHVLNKALTIRAFINREETDVSHATKQLLENEAREDLNPIELARGYQRLIDLGRKQKDLVELTGKSQPVVANTLRLLELPPAVQGLISRGQLSHAHGVVLVKWAKWPLVCEVIAHTVESYQWSAKQLQGRELPFAQELKKAGHVTEIYVGDHEYDGRRRYVMPAALKSDPDFIEEGYQTWFYLHPAPGQPNKWAPIRDAQDLARAKEEQAEKKRVAANDAKNPGLSKEAKERKAKIQKNKAARALIVAARTKATAALKGQKKQSDAALHVVIEAALADGRHAQHVEFAASELGIKLPKFKRRYHDHGRSLAHEDLYNLKSHELLHLAALCVMLRQAHDAARFVDSVPPALDYVGGAKK